VSTKRTHAGRPKGPQLTDRDLEILRWMTRHGVVTAELVGQRFFWRAEQRKYGQWAAYRRLAALERLGLILRDKPWANRPGVLRVTSEGARLADVGLRPAPLVLSQLRHTLAVVLLVEGLAYKQPGTEYVTERELRAERYRQRRAGVDISRGRVPDGILQIPDKRTKTIRRVALELDITRKDRRALENMVHRYDQEPDIDAVWWYTLGFRVERTQAVVRDLAAQDRFEVREWRAPT
jgi:hypothetical protein